MREGEVFAIDSLGGQHWIDWKNQKWTPIPAGKLNARIAAAFPDGLRIVVSGKSTVRIVDPASPASSRDLEKPDAKINCLAVSPDGKTIAGGGDDECVRLWDVATGQLRAVWPGHTREVHAVTFAPSGNLLISSAGYAGTAWWVRGGEVLLWATDTLPSTSRDAYRLQNRRFGFAAAAAVKGQIAEGHGDWELARKHFQQACDHWPADANRWKQLGKVHFRLEQFDKAAAAFTNAVELSKLDANNYWWLGATLLLSGQKDQFQKIAEQSQQLHSENSGVLMEIARTANLGVGTPQTVQQALSLAEGVTRAKSTVDWELRVLATSRIRAGQLEAGNKYHLEALDRHPMSHTNILHWLPLAIAAHRKGDLQEARKWFEKATMWMDQTRKDFPRELATPQHLHINDWLEAQVLFKEVGELLEMPKK